MASTGKSPAQSRIWERQSEMYTLGAADMNIRRGEDTRRADLIKRTEDQRRNQRKKVTVEVSNNLVDFHYFKRDSLSLSLSIDTKISRRSRSKPLSVTWSNHQITPSS